MKELADAFVKLPFPVIMILIGAGFVIGPCITIDDWAWSTHPPTTYIPVIVGVFLLIASIIIFIWRGSIDKKSSTGIDMTKVRNDGDVLITTVGQCEIRVVSGRIEDFVNRNDIAVVLPCNEYFDDHCAGDLKSSLGAFVNRAFDGQVEDFMKIVREESAKRLGPGTEQQKTDDERAISFGAGRCILLHKPLGRAGSIALVSTTTQRSGQGLVARISYLFDGMNELFSRLADTRLGEVVMPILGAGHGRIYSPLAMVGLILAVAETARYGHTGRRLKAVTIVLFKRDAASVPEVDELTVRRALALVGKQD